MRTVEEVGLEYARGFLQENLAKCTEKQQKIFINMYMTDKMRIEAKKGNWPRLIDVIMSMPLEQMNWAMEQVKNTLDKTGD